MTHSTENARPLGDFVGGPVMTLAARIKAALEEAGIQEDTSYGVFYVRRVEIAYSDGGVTEPCLYLVPDEAEGKTLDAYTPRFRPAAPSEGSE